MKTIYILLSILVLSSCVSTRELQKRAPKEKEYVQCQEGKYNNCPSSADGFCNFNQCLFDVLTRKLKSKDSLENWNAAQISLERGKKSLTVSEWHKNEVFRSVSLKGKWKENDFYVQRRVFPIGLPPFFYFYKENQLILKFTNESLIVLNGYYEFAMAFVILNGGTDGMSSTEYLKLEE